MSFHSYNKNTGFSLIELMVSIGIMMVITTVVLVNQSSYTSNISLNNLANDIGLTIRQAQIYGVSVKGDANDFTNAYGVEFNTTAQGSNGSYIFFADKGVTKNGYYDDLWTCPTNSECIKKIPLTSGNIIQEICVVRTADSGECGGHPGQIVDRADITFVRPSNDAKIVFFNDGSQIPQNPNIQGMQITIKSLSGITRSIMVYTTGQISVK